MYDTHLNFWSSFSGKKYVLYTGEDGKPLIHDVRVTVCVRAIFQYRIRHTGKVSLNNRIGENFYE